MTTFTTNKNDNKICEKTLYGTVYEYDDGRTVYKMFLMLSQVNCRGRSYYIIVASKIIRTPRNLRIFTDLAS